MARVTSGQTLIWEKEACKTQLLGLSSYGATSIWRTPTLIMGDIFVWTRILLSRDSCLSIVLLCLRVYLWAVFFLFFVFPFACLPWPQLKEVLKACPPWGLSRFYTLLPLVPTRAPGSYCTTEIVERLFFGNNVSSKFGLLLIYLLLVNSRYLWAPQGLLGIIIMLI